VLFAVGVFIGCVAGLVAALALSLPDRMFFAKQTVPVIIALAALVVGSVALVESTRSRGSTASAIAPPPTTTTVPSPPSSVPAPPSTTGVTAPSGDLKVPNVLRLTENDALTTLSHAGFQANVESIALANVPSGYVMSQAPLPESSAPPGTTVSLQVSAGA
jgi:hypothetical protein